MKRLAWSPLLVIVMVAATLGAAEVQTASGEDHTLMLDAHGQVWAWGTNTYGQLGDGTTTTSATTPVQVTYASTAVLTDMIAVAAFGETNNSTSLALRADGTVWSWGANTYGQLGNNTNGAGTEQNRAVQVQKDTGANLTNIITISCGRRNGYALAGDGTIWAWGDNTYGQLCNGATSGTPTDGAVQIGSLSNIIAIAGGAYHALALRADGTVWSWGINSSGECGDNTTTGPRTAPVQVKISAGSFLTNVIAVAAGNDASMALTVSGEVYCWGDNSYSQLGNGTSGGNAVVATNSSLSYITKISCGQWGHKLALKYDGTVYGWGYNGDGRMGYAASAADQPTPVVVDTPAGTPVRSISAGRQISSFVLADGRVYTAGNVFSSSTPTLVSARWPMTGIQRVAAGTNHTLALKADGTVWAWGDNSLGQLGDGNSGSYSDDPVQVMASAGTPLTNVVAIVAGGQHSVALRADGYVYCWGYGTFGQLGNGLNASSNYPVNASGFARSIGASRYTTYAITPQGYLQGWGFNGGYNLASGDTTNQPSPTYMYTSLFVYLNTVKAVEGGYNHAVALRADGTARGIGQNGYGQLGDGGTSTPTYASTVCAQTMLKAVAAGQYHCLWLKGTGDVYASGANGYSQLGDGGITQQPTPIQIGAGVFGTTGAKAIAAGNDFGDTSIALRGDGRVYGWGSNSDGQTGDGAVSGTTTTPNLLEASSTPLSFEGRMSSIASGDYHSLAVKPDGTVKGWGRNSSGQLGNSTTTGSVVAAITVAATPFWLPTITVSASDSTAAEAGLSTGTYTVTRTLTTVGMISVSYTMTGTATSGSDYTAPTGAVTISAGSATATVTLSPLDDSIDENSETAILNVSANAVRYQVGSPSTATVNISSDDTAGVTVNSTPPLTTTESGGTATFTIQLNTQPTASVSFSIASSSTSEGTVSTAAIYFAAAATGTGSGLSGANLRAWNNPATITITGVNDSPAVVDGNIGYSILIGAATSADPKYPSTIDPTDLSVTNNDNDTAGFTIGTVSGSKVLEVAKTLNSTSCTVGLIQFPGGSDLSKVAINMRALCTSATTNVGVARVISAVDDAADTVTVALPISAAGAETWTLGESGLVGIKLLTVPAAPVTLGVSVSDSSEGSINTGTLSFNSGDWNIDHFIAISPVNDDEADGNIVWQIITAAATSSDANYNGINPSDITITTADDDTAGVTIVESGGTTTITEGGATDTYTMKLNSQPTADVTITPSPNSQVTVSPTTLTFTTANWNSTQTITVTAFDDSVGEGSHAGSITHSASGGGYGAVSISSVTPTITDNDTAGFTLSATSGLVTTEAGGTASFTIRLSTQPTASVNFAISSSNTNEGTVSPAALYFGAVATGDGTGSGPANLRLWSSAATVTVTGVDEAIDDGDTAYTIVTLPATSGDGLYSGLNPSDVSVSNTDNDTAGMTIVQTGGTTAVTEGGATDTYTIALNSQPTAKVTITLDGGSQVTPSVTTMYFGDVASGTGDGLSSANARLWSNAFTVTTTALNDSVAEGSHSGSVTHTGLNGGYTAVSLPTLSVTITDNDTAGATLTAMSGNTTESGGTATFTIVLTSQPTASVSIGLTSSNTGEGTVSLAAIWFGAAATGAGTGADASNLRLWSSAATITVTGVNDSPAAVDGSVAYTITTAPAVSSDVIYSGLNPADVAAINNDNDVAAITIVESGGSTVITESGTTDTYTVVLTTQPSGTVTVTPSPNAQITVSPTTLSFTTGNWNSAQTITVTAVNDPDIEGAHAGSITHAASAGGYDAVVIASVAPSITDNDTAGVTVTPTAGLTTSESGGTATFTMVLTSRPSANVVLGLSSTNTAEGTVSPASLTFTNGNWNTAQTVTITGVEDAGAADGNQAYTITTAAASSGDGNYNTVVNPSDVSVSNDDNDVPGVTILPLSGLTTSEDGSVALFSAKLNTLPNANVTFSLTSSDTAEGTVSAASLTFTVSNWNSFQTVTITGVDDSIDDGNKAYTIQTGVVSAPGESTGYNSGSLNPSDVSVTNIDNDTASATVAITGGFTLITEAGGTDTYTIVLGTRPTGTVAISILADSQSTVNKSTVYFKAAASGTGDGTSAANALAWNTPSTITITAVNDSVAEGSHSTTITHAIDAVNSTSTEFVGLSIASATAVITDNDTAGFTVSAISGATTEAGGTATCTVVLTSQPTANVVVAVTSSTLTEATVSPASLTFTAGNWNTAQTVTATGVNDSVDDGNISYTIQIAAAVSADTGYSGLDPTDVTASNTDDDTVGVTITATGGSTDVSETGGNDSYTMVLNSKPTANVTITITPDAQVEVDTDLVTAGYQHTLSFDNTTWNIAQVVTVTGIDDSEDEASPHTGSITHAAAGGDYTVVSIASVAANVTDNDTAAVTVGSPSGSIVEGGATATYTLVLDTKPTATVTLTVTADAQTSVDKTQVFFGATASGSGDGSSSANARLWSSSSTVTVTAVNDSVAEGSHTGTITHTASGGGYTAVAIGSVTPTITDNDTPGVTVSPTSGLSVTELGGTSIFTVVLQSQPTANVTIALSSTDTGEGTVSPASLTYTSATWNIPQSVTITGVNDAIDDGTQAFTITTGAAASGDASYNLLDVADVSVSCIDDDAAGVTLSTTAISLTEGGATATYTMVLNTQPSVDVTLTINPDGQETTSLSSVIFAAAAAGDGSGSSVANARLWSNAVTITATAVNDDIAEGSHVGSISHAASGGEYGSVTVSATDATITDNDSAGFVIGSMVGMPREVGGGSHSYATTSAVSASKTIQFPASTDLSTAFVGQLVKFTSDDGGVSGVNYGTIGTIASVDDGNDRIVVNEAVVDSASAERVTFYAGASIRLASKPTSVVVINLTASSSNEGAITPSAMTFSPSNWDQVQIVTAVGNDDSVDDGNVVWSVVTGSAFSPDAYYNSLDPANISVTTVDDDTAALVVTATTIVSRLTTTEAGGTTTFTVALATQPTAAVTVTLASSNTGQGTLDLSTVSFTTADWATAQTVTVTGVDGNSTDDGNVDYTASVTPSSSDAVYNVGGLAKTIYLTNVSVNNTPTLSALSAVTLDEDFGTSPVNLAGIGSGQTGETQVLTVTATSSNTNLVTVTPASQVAVGTTATLTLTSVADVTGTATITVTVQDNGGTANGAVDVVTKTFLVTVNPVNDVPVVTVVGGGTTFTEGAGAATVLGTGSLNVTDVDNTALFSGTVRIANQLDGTVESLAATTTGTSITASYDSATGIMSLSTGASQPISDWQSVLRSITYNNTSQNPNTTARSITIVVNDESGDSVLVAQSVAMTAVNNAPVLDLDSGTGGTGYASTWTEGAGAVSAVASTGLTLSDPDSASLVGATAVLAATPDGVNEVLAATTTATAITASYSGGTLTLSGSDTVANYQIVLRSMTYNNADQDPDTTARSILITVDDGAASGTASATAALSMVAVNNSPTLDLDPGTGGTGSVATYTEDAAPVAIVAAGLVLTDPDSINLTNGATVQILNIQNAGIETLAAPGAPGGIAVSYSASTGILTLSGNRPVADYQTALASLTYANSSQNPNATVRQIQVDVDDGAGGTTSATAAVSVVATNDAPVVDLNGTVLPLVDTTLAYSEGDGAKFLAPGAALDDADSTNLQGITAVFTVVPTATETLAATVTGTNITASYVAATGTLSLTGVDTVANYLSVLRTITYEDTSSAPTAGVRTVSVTATDGTIGPVAACDITVTPVNDAPYLVPGSTLTTTVGLRDPVTITQVMLDFTDDDGPNPLMAKVLVLPSQGNLLLSGVALVANAPFAVADIAAGLLVYDNNGTTPIDDAFAIRALDSAGTPAQSDVSVFTITVTGLPPPVFSALDADATTWTEDTVPVAIDLGVDATVDDPASGPIDTGFFTGGTLTVSYGASGSQATDLLALDVTGTITLSGTTVSYSATPIGTLSSAGLAGGPLQVTLLAAATETAITNLLHALRFSSSYDNPVAGLRNLHIVLEDGTGALPAIADVTVTVVPFDDPPIAVDQTIVLVPGLKMSGQLVATDVDSAAPVFTLAALPAAQASKGVPLVNANGTFTYEHQTLSGLADTFTFTATSSGKSVNGTVTVVVTPQDAVAPRVTSAPPMRATAGALFSYTPVLAGFSTNREYVLAPTLQESVSGAVYTGSAWTFASGLSGTGADGTITIPNLTAPTDGSGYLRFGILIIDRTNNRAAYQPILLKVAVGGSG